MQYTTLSRLKEKLWITTEYSDSELSLIIDNATQLIDNVIWFNLDIKTITERVNWTWSNKIYLKNIPNSIGLVKSKDWFITYDVDFSEWYIVYFEENIPNWIKNISVIYEIWFAEVPKDIEAICLDICVILCDQVWIKWTNSEKLINKNIQTQKLWNLSITYFWEKEKRKNSFDVLDPGIDTLKILNKYKSFSWLYS
jgi:hypothetical protein